LSSAFSAPLAQLLREVRIMAKSRLEKHHEEKVLARPAPGAPVAVTPAAMEIEKLAIAREERGQYRVAAGLWLKCMDKACGEVERARIAVRRQRCIGFSNGRRGEYSGISAGCISGVIYD